MSSFQKDENNDEVLLSSQNGQIMMEWEKPYMEKSIDFLQTFRKCFRSRIWMWLFCYTNYEISYKKLYYY